MPQRRNHSASPLWLTFLAAVSLTLTSCLNDFDVRSLSGVITDSESEEPIENAEVRIRWDSDSAGVGVKTKYDTTGTDGYYEFKVLPPNTFELKAYKTGYDTTERDLSFGKGIRLNFEMTKSEVSQ